MIRQFYILVALMALNLSLFSQSCLPDGIIFDTQESIDNFQTNYPGCTEIEGDVYIQGNEISHLAGLSVLTAFNGNVIIREMGNLFYLNGLENITTVGGDLTIEYMWQLRRVQALGNLTSVGGSLIIQDCDSLLSFEGFENLSTIGDDFYYRYTECAIENYVGFDNLSSIGGYFVTDWTRIVNFTGVENLTSIGESLIVNRCDYFESYNGLDGLTSIGDGLGLEQCPLITNFEGLENLTSIGGGLYVRQNAGLENFSGLEFLTSIGGALVIEQNGSLNDLSHLSSLISMDYKIQILLNPSLTSLIGLDNIDPSTLSTLLIMDNISLSHCAVQSICEYLENPGNVQIDFNATGCNTDNEVIDACESLSTEDLILDESIHLFPNPASQEINLRSSLLMEHSIISIYDLYGKEIEEITKPGGQTELQINISTYVPGVYVLIIQDKNGALVRSKFVVRN